MLSHRLCFFAVVNYNYAKRGNSGEKAVCAGTMYTAWLIEDVRSINGDNIGNWNKV